MGPCWLSFQCPECSLYSIAPLAFTSGGHYWTDRDGFGGHGIYGFHQTFIPAFNSTTARVERPDSKGRRIESQRSGNSQPISRKKTGSTFCWLSTIWLENKPDEHNFYCDNASYEKEEYESWKVKVVFPLKTAKFLSSSPRRRGPFQQSNCSCANHLNSLESLSCCDVRKTLSAVEWLQGECQLCFWKLAKWQGFHWCDPGMWGWPADGGTQTYPGFFKSFLSEDTSIQQTSPSTDLPQRISVQRLCVYPGLPIFWRGKCLPRRFGFFPCHSRGNSTIGFDWASHYYRSGWGARKPEPQEQR